MPNSTYKIDSIFDGGDMDCGSGLILLIRQHMLEIPEGGIMELLSREPTVSTELPPWCRMVGHEHLASIKDESENHWKHYIKRGVNQTGEADALAEDKQKALNYEWRLRARHTDNQEATIYTRNFSWKIGQPASFEEQDTHPCALEFALGALLADTVNGFASHCLQKGYIIDDLEGNLKASLHNVLAHLGLESGTPALKHIHLSAFITSPVAGADLRETWENTLQRSPLYQTLKNACSIETRLAIL